jgi:hypothetical protein
VKIRKVLPLVVVLLVTSGIRADRGGSLYARHVRASDDPDVYVIRDYLVHWKGFGCMRIPNREVKMEISAKTRRVTV